ncbi:hypothetical protein D3C79_808940 [compost metagenome]
MPWRCASGWQRVIARLKVTTPLSCIRVARLMRSGAWLASSLRRCSRLSNNAPSRSASIHNCLALTPSSASVGTAAPLLSCALNASSRALTHSTISSCTGTSGGRCRLKLTRRSSCAMRWLKRCRATWPGTVRRAKSRPAFRRCSGSSRSACSTRAKWVASRYLAWACSWASRN